MDVVIFGFIGIAFIGGIGFGIFALIRWLWYLGTKAKQDSEKKDDDLL